MFDRHCTTDLKRITQPSQLGGTRRRPQVILRLHTLHLHALCLALAYIYRAISVAFLSSFQASSTRRPSRAADVSCLCSMKQLEHRQHASGARLGTEVTQRFHMSHLHASCLTGKGRPLFDRHCTMESKSHQHAIRARSARSPDGLRRSSLMFSSENGNTAVSVPTILGPDGPPAWAPATSSTAAF